MLKQLRSDTGYERFDVRSSGGSAIGVEVATEGVPRLSELLAFLRVIGHTTFARPPAFVVADLPGELSASEIAALTGVARQTTKPLGLALVCPIGLRSLGATISELNRAGIEVLLGNVGPTTRFCDMDAHPVVGVVFDRAFISTVGGDPHAACMLEAMTTLAKNLGLKTFASRAGQQMELDAAISCGVEYVSSIRGFVDQDPRCVSPSLRIVEQATPLRSVPSQGRGCR